MNADLCLCCNQEENYNRNSDTEYVCGSCVQLLFNADQDELKRAHELALAKSRADKVRAIESFILPEETENEQQRPKSKSRFHSHRIRSSKFVRREKERIRLATA